MIKGLNRGLANCRNAGTGVRHAILWFALANLFAAAAHAQGAPAADPAATASPPADAPVAAPPAPSAVPAEAAGPGGTLQEIVITATRHEEVLSKVPESVTAFSQETLDLKGVRDFTDIARYTPGVNIDRSGGNNISIRGISASGGSGTTGIYIDDTPIQMRSLGFNSDDTLPKTFDLDRVEVLRGPQGTLFGAGSEGGTIRYIMAAPNMHETSVYARSELSFTKNGSPNYEAGVAGGTPIVDGTLGVRASIWYRHDGGWIDQIDPTTLATVQSKSNYSDTVAGRVAAKWAVNDLLTITPSVIFQNRLTHDITAYWPIYSDPSAGIFRNADPDRQPQPDRYVLPALKIETEVAGASLISNTSYYSRREQSGYNGTEYNLSYFQTFWEQGMCADGTQTPYDSSQHPAQAPCPPAPSWYPLIDGKGIHLPFSATGWNPQTYRAPATVTNQQNTITEELRLQSSDPNAALVWTTGLYFSVNRQTSVEEINDPALAQFMQYFYNMDPAGGANDYTAWFGQCLDQFCSNFVPIPLLANGDDYYNRNFSRDTQLALFGEATYAVTDKLKLTAGVRVSKTNVSYDHFSTGPQNFATNLNSGSQQDHPFTPKLGVSYQADSNDLYYATYAKGFRIGGANPAIPFNPCAPDFLNLNLPGGAPQTYDSDTVNSYEIGAKNKIGGNFRIASSLYFIKWNNIQQNVYMPGCGLQFTMNMNNAVAKGGDAQIEWAPTESLSFDVALGFTDARYTQDVGTAGHQVARSGDAVVGESGTSTPPWTITVGAQYDFSAWDRKSFVRVDVEHQSMNHNLTAMEDPGAQGVFDPYAYTPAATTFVSLRAGTSFDKNWNLSAFVDNLFNIHPDLPPSPDLYAHTDVDPYNATPPTPLLRRYTFRPRTMGFTATYRF
jgi:iron complex outermembrane recepter protein